MVHISWGFLVWKNVENSGKLLFLLADRSKLGEYGQIGVYMVKHVR